VATVGGRRGPVVHVLDEDPDLGEGLDDAQAEAVRRRGWASALHLAIGDWDPGAWPFTVTNGFGLLVVEGLLLRRIRVGERFGAELLADGDLLRPWQREEGVALAPREQHWTVLEPARLAVLDVEFAQRVSAVPQLAGRLAARAIRRSRQFAVNLAIIQQPRVETRLHLMLWHLADRRGIVVRDGVLVPLRLTQALLAELVAARRPTVSAALGVLEREGRISRTDRGWLLHGAAPGELPLLA